MLEYSGGGSVCVRVCVWLDISGSMRELISDVMRALHRCEVSGSTELLISVMSTNAVNIILIRAEPGLDPVIRD